MTRFLPCAFCQLLRRNKKAQQGNVAVEMALIAPPFFLLLMGIIEFCLMAGAQQIMENAAYNTSRLAKTGFVSAGSDQAQTVSQIMVDELSSYGTLIDTSKVTLTSADYTSFAGAAAGGGKSGYGTAQQIVVYTITYPWKLFTPMMSEIIGTSGIVNLNATIVVRNEPYS